jgi:hypothetical protein
MDLFGLVQAGTPQMIENSNLYIIYFIVYFILQNKSGY